MFTEHVQSRADQRALTRTRVLAAAEDLFRTRGYTSTTVRQIAARAEVSVGTVVAVGDKSALLVEIFDSWIAGVHRERAGRRAPPNRDLPNDVTGDIVNLFEPFVDYFARDRELSREYAAVVVRGTHDTPIFRDLGGVLISEVHQTLTHAGLDTVQAGRGATAIYFTYLGVLMAVSNGALSDETGRDQFRDVVNLVVNPERER